MIPMALEPGYPDDTPEKALHVTIAFWLDEAGASPSSALSDEQTPAKASIETDALSVLLRSLLHEAEGICDAVVSRGGRPVDGRGRVP